LPSDYTFTPADNAKANFGLVFFTPGDQILTVTDTVSRITANVTITVTSPAGAAAPRGAVHGPLTPGSKGAILAGRGLSSGPEIASLDWFFASLHSSSPRGKAEMEV
jgi:hypothetical protein